jgi:hypothetical protein
MLTVRQGIIINKGIRIKGKAQDIRGIRNKKGTETRDKVKLTIAVRPALAEDFSRGLG